MIGSANCSGAAWIHPLNKGGNIESIVVFDEADPVAFANLLTTFTVSPAVPADEITNWGSAQVDEQESVDKSSFRRLSSHAVFSLDN